MPKARPQPSATISFRMYVLVVMAARKYTETWDTGFPGEILDHAAGLTTDYSGPFVYENSTLAFIQTSEGRIVPDHDAYDYEYFLKDHLGNTRVVFNEQGEVLQNNSYYPFGGIMEGLNFTADLRPENKYLYNGKEMQDDFGLDWPRFQRDFLSLRIGFTKARQSQASGEHDYGARFYDAQLGRWHVSDPIAEDYNQWSLYNYTMNNPIKFIDPDGMRVDKFYFEKEIEQKMDKNGYKKVTSEIHVENEQQATKFKVGRKSNTIITGKQKVTGIDEKYVQKGLVPVSNSDHKNIEYQTKYNIFTNTKSTYEVYTEKVGYGRKSKATTNKVVNAIITVSNVASGTHDYRRKTKVNIYE